VKNAPAIKKTILLFFHQKKYFELNLDVSSYTSFSDFQFFLTENFDFVERKLKRNY
jgi:hypothetical protein